MGPKVVEGMQIKTRLTHTYIHIEIQCVKFREVSERAVEETTQLRTQIQIIHQQVGEYFSNNGSLVRHESDQGIKFKMAPGGLSGGVLMYDKTI